ncbi:VOC family protein [Nocardioides pantholopis]|uniref:VOC family protein n=1 Tax=Nocardioides pantholopis TaxID=2483798 RepID=UPI000FD8CF40|nr:VOC family protein [Nocardioides pantholopis]
MIASWKDLCIDAVDVDLMARFWGGLLGREVESRGDLRLLTGATPGHSVWINPVPEPVTVKQRVHLDVHAASVDDVLDLGATPLDLDSFDWRVLRDPEGGELCVFERQEVPQERLYEIAVDCADPERLATWWGDVLGAPVRPEPHGEGYAVADIPGAPFDSLVFAAVPERKAVKNRIHWDVDTASVDLLVGAGARMVRPPDPEISWSVLADPEGNEFCVFTR